MAGMLPPFVPPAARVTTETLPSITEFVVDRVEQSFDSSFSLEGSADAGVATLPSIEEFVLHPPDSDVSAETGEDEFVQRTTRSPWGTYEEQNAVSGAPGAPAPPVPGALEPDLMAVERRTPPSGSEDAIVNEVAEPADAWAASAARGLAVDETVNEVSKPSEPSSESVAATTPVAPEVWVAEERDAFVTTLFGESVQLSFDPEGRVTLPEHLIAAAGIKEAATFVGKGEVFEIWEPAAFANYAKRARELVREKRFMMKGGKA